MLRYSKFLLRRLAYVPWLLAVGLVLGGAEEAVAQSALTVYPDVVALRRAQRYGVHGGAVAGS